ALEWDGFFLRTLFGVSVSVPGPAPAIYLSEAEKQEGRAYWKRNGVEGKRVVFLGLGASRPAKRWPAAQFAELAAILAGQGVRPVVVGAASDSPLAAIIAAACPTAIDLTGRTSLLELGGIAARASLAVGNDTGPMHLAAAAGCRCVVLFSGASDPALTAPRGRVTILREPDLARLPLARVAAALA
ncbi:MAG: glycosyltransferase family 9 protein, partial [Gemmatimonadaceae bacterium]|nr:glycosyltransferase family 9 protein [Acetobacteraceae bacterium]